MSQTHWCKIGIIVWLAAIFLSGCGLDSTRRLEGVDRGSAVAERYPIGAELQRAHVDVSGYTGHGAESSTAYFETVKFVRAYAVEGRGPLRIATPRQGGTRDVDMVKRVVRAHGLADTQVRMHARSDGAKVVTLAYDRVGAIVPADCYDQAPLSDPRAERDVGTAFGCASQRNLALMLADPSHLVVAAPEPDRGSERRAILHQDHRDRAPGR